MSGNAAVRSAEEISNFEELLQTWFSNEEERRCRQSESLPDWNAPGLVESREAAKQSYSALLEAFRLIPKDFHCRCCGNGVAS